jgi:transcriptional regulator GlxA family with amidase domain
MPDQFRSDSGRDSQRTEAMPTVNFIVPESFQTIWLASFSVFEMANASLKRNAYDVRILSEHGGLVRGAHGFAIETAPLDERYADTTLAVGALRPGRTSEAVLAYLKKAAKRSRRVAGPCTGAFALAEAGLLDGHEATTHWAYAQELKRLYPKVRVAEDRIHIQSGKMWTSAGATAGIDLALAFVEEDFGAELAKSVARKLVVYHRRPGGQSQFSALIELDPNSDRIRRVLAYAKEHLTNELSVEELAEVAHLSPRQFSRVFTKETGQSPAKAIERLRLEAARLQMEDGRVPMDMVARTTGFADRDRMRRAFLRIYGQPPQFFRRGLKRESEAA